MPLTPPPRIETDPSRGLPVGEPAWWYGPSDKAQDHANTVIKYEVDVRGDAYRTEFGWFQHVILKGPIYLNVRIEDLEKR
jgi:hypothetical protein